MVYRDELSALTHQVSNLEQDNAKLKRALVEAESKLQRLSAEKHAERKREARSGCALCGGTLLPIAMFAGYDWRVPQPISMSTMRFRSPQGGFTHAAPIQSMACASCGYIHNFIEVGGRSDHDHLPAVNDAVDRPIEIAELPVQFAAGEAARADAAAQAQAQSQTQADKKTA